MSTNTELLDKVKQSLKWKESYKKTAKKLGITVNEYKNLKAIVLGNKVHEELESFIKSNVHTFKPVYEYKEYVDKGTAEYKALSSTEPQTAEEIEELLKLDKTKWKLSSYWNKQTTQGWIISAQVTQIKKTIEEDVKSVFDSIELEYKPITSETFINKAFEDETCAVLSLQDIHIGKENLDGSGPEDTVKSVQECIKNLVMRSYQSNNLDKIIFVLGGDLLNMDTYLGSTTSGTIIENSIDAYSAYKIAFELMHWSVNYLKQFCNTLEVVYIPGNHSRLSEAHIAYALSKSITDSNIIWNVDYAERKVVTYGSSMLCLEHGDYDTRKSFYVFATEFAKEWGSTEHRVLYTGHYHKEKTIQYITRDETNGFTIKILPSLSKTDKYHYSNKWTNNKRGGIIELYSKTKGCTGSFSYFE